MKKIIFFSIALFAFTIKVNAQITLEHTYNSAGSLVAFPNYQQLYIVNLEVDGEKYVFVDRANKEVKFYNLNHTLWKTISYAGTIDLNSGSNTRDILYISQHLFDTDNEIEFLYDDIDQNDAFVSVTQIVNEDGSILFTENNAGPWVKINFPQPQLSIYNTVSGTKMILSLSNGDANVYSLAGTLSAGIVANPSSELNQLKTSVAYPNPTNSSTKIDYTLPNNITKGEIVFYDTHGKEIKRFNVDNTFNSLLISTEDLQSGIYYYNLQTTQGNSGAKKLVTVK
ncbi:MAG: T9SS type A sorting domain-containing protein [Bacteroidia bacterium]